MRTNSLCILRAIGLGFLVLAVSLPTVSTEAASYVVNTTDDADDGSCDARHCSLREAVNAANENPGPDTITFNIPGRGPHAIQVNGTALILEDDGTTIDGTTQPGYSTTAGRYGPPAVYVRGPTSLDHAGLWSEEAMALNIASDNNIIRGLGWLACFPAADVLMVGNRYTVGASNNLIEGNQIGLDSDGAACLPPVLDPHAAYVAETIASVFRPAGVTLRGDSNSVLDNTIAGILNGIRIWGANNVVRGNYIGVGPSGSDAVSGMQIGILTYGATGGNLIGGEGTGEANVISGANVGLILGSDSDQVVGNLIGTDATGSALVGNSSTGVLVLGQANAVMHNTISGNPVGIQVGGIYQWRYDHPAAAFTGGEVAILGNLVGTTADGTAAIPNGRGILLGPEAATVEIGSPIPSNANLISGNEIGIEVQGGSPVIIANRIGTDAAGTAAIPNQYGIIIWDRAAGVQVGTAFAGEGNTISGNTRTGLWLRSNAGVVQGNWIGLAADGRAALPNDTGLDVDGDSNQIGGEGAGAANVISGNEDGVVVDGESNVLLGNLIGTDPSGSLAIPNTVGIYLSGHGNTLGEAAAPNLISGNGRGLVVTGSHNTIEDNRIGTDLAAAAELPNGVGIELFGPYNQIGSGTLPGNQVLFNEGPGIRLSSLAVGNTIAGNTVAFNAQEGIRVEPGGGVALNTFSRNSLYQNGWLGIDLLPGAQHDVVPPVIDRITVAGESTAGSIQGRACPGCQVELFLADPDPSGSGEGRTFYAAGPAADSGVFTSPVPPGIAIGMCQPFTATSTDAEGNTSEFSLNRTPFGCLRMPWWLLVLGVAGLLGAGAIGGGLAGGPHGRPALGGIAGGAAGGLVGVVIALVLVRLPFVQIVGRQTPEGGGPPVASLPPCAQFINSTQLRPEDGAAFDLGTDVLFELSPQPDPPGIQTRWTLHLSGPSGLEVSEVLSTPSTSLASLGVDAPSPGAYLWRLSADRLDAATGAWNPFCADLADRAFFLLQPTPVPTPETPVPEPSEIPTPTYTPTPTSVPPMATFLTNANCRRDQGTVYDVVTSILQGQTVLIDGRNAQGTWWRVLPEGLLTGCWVSASTVEVMGDVSAVPLIAAGPTPTPEQACWVQACGQCPLVCTLPCPENAQPGGACTP
jgi:CSLREA domain-containing protein